MAKVSVIVPVYKVEAFLPQCVESILSQTYRDFELILVDDGSPDRCPEMCDEYALKDPRVTAIHKKNGGLSSARNAGILAATGEYVLFVDSDDWLNKTNAIALLLQRVEMSHAQVLCFSYSKIYEQSGKTVRCLEQPQPMPVSCRSKAEQEAYLAARGLYIASACNKLLRLELLKKNNLFFPVGETSEDVVWCLRLLLAADSLDFLNEDLYCYRQRAGSISQTLSLKKCRQLADQILECITLTGELAKSSPVASAYTAYQFATFMKVQTFAESYPEDCVKKLAPYSGLLIFHGNNKKMILLRVMTQLLGYERSCKILYRLYDTRRGA